MSKQVWYLAHPVSGDARGNAEKAIAWVKFLTKEYPDTIFIAPWVAEVLAFADDVVDPEFYDRVLSDDELVVAHCDGVLLTGTHVSNGMKRERDAARRLGKPVVNITGTTIATPEGFAAEFGEPLNLHCMLGIDCTDTECAVKGVL